MTSVARRERMALCGLLEEKGPLAPTLCEGWATSDLAAHLFVRERRLLAMPGILVPALSRVTDKAMESAKRQFGYSGLIERIRSGPPAPLRFVDRRMNTFEYFVHHEDVRRAAEGWAPRTDPSLDAALWAVLRLGARLLGRRLHGTGLELQAPGFGVAVVKRAEPSAVVSGGPQELALLMAGRQAAAKVEIAGPDAARSAIEDGPFGL